MTELYGTETKKLKQAVKRNIERFAERYMFELTIAEAEASRPQNVTLKRGENIKYLPYAFTEHGVMMLSNMELINIKSEYVTNMVNICDII